MANLRIPRSRRSTQVATPSPPEGFLRAYHIAPAEFAISNIRAGRIKVARFMDLNDPFELMAMNFMERRTRKIVGDFKVEYESRNGLLCFSEQWKNPVLWSHYGAKHRGICLGFNLKKDLAQRVRYEDRRIRAELEERGSPFKIDRELQDLLICTKFRHWQYEKELRVIVPLEEVVKEGPLHFYLFNDNLQLAEVILGPKCSESLDAVRRLARTQHPHVVVFKARLGFKFFNVVPDKSTVARL
jgi:Protein of unknown function (DUF2971)